jgi:myo-inositol 2-dehydrogenase/D-chiro-inositol 1-dehydrogenase
MKKQSLKEETSRREFLKTSAAFATAVALGNLDVSRYAHASGDETVRIGMIGCGGRCTGAAVDAMDADAGVKLVAMADLFMERVREKRKYLKDKKPQQVAVDDDHCFAGFDGYKRVVESSDVVLIANAAKFHPLHMKAAIEAGRHVFVEKPHAIDPAGIKTLLAACELAKQKKLCVVSGLQSRYHPGYRETISRIHDGAIGEIVAIEENFLRAPYGLYARKPGMNEVQYQCSNQYHFDWLSGDDVPQSLVHNLDRASWAMREQVPVKAHGLGGRSSMFDEIYGNVFDHHSVIYEFANGVKMYAFCRTQEGCYNEVSSILLGTKGRCNVLAMRIQGETNWHYTSREGENPYRIEHQELFAAVRSGQPINNGDYMARSTLIGIMGQISCYTGKEVTWEQVSKSDFYYPPRPEECSFDMEPLVRPDAKGSYPVAVPGKTKLL